MNIIKHIGFLAIVSLIVIPRAEAEELSADQFLRFVKEQQSLIKDVAFAFEGERQPVDPEEEGADPRTSSHQGRYALRADGATYLEQVRTLGAKGIDQHSVKAMIRGRGEEALFVSGSFITPGGRAGQRAAGPGSFFAADSPETFVFLWRFQALESASDFGYSFLGWEDIDGHRCAHIEFNPHPGKGGRVLQELWVDLERGGHTLRIRNSDGNDTVYGVDEIRLAEFDLPSGERIWFPVRGRHDRYYGESGQYSREPVVQTTTYILNGTLVFNQGLGDGVFRVKADRFRPAFTPARDEVARRADRGSVADLESAERALDEKLAEFSGRGPGLDAARATRAEASAWSTTGRWLGGLGLVAIVVAGLVAWRRGG
jgi:hypothetical protein